MPALITELGFTKSELGLLGSIMSISYAVSKFSSGILADKMNPRYLMGIGLLFTGIINIAFGLSSSLIAFGVLWGLNGFFQGFGAPPCAKLLIHWYSQEERGTWWSIWNTSHNIGGALIPLLVGFCVYHYGWRYGMYAPGVICVFGGLLLINRLRDTPESLGLPPVESVNGKAERKGEKHALSVREILWDHVIKNKFILMLGVAYFFVYVIRTAVNDWSALFLTEVHDYDSRAAGGVVFWFEVGGFFGSLAAGWASDKIFSGMRGPVNVLFMFGTLLAVYSFWCFGGRYMPLDSALLFAMGFLIFGPQMLVGMAAAEITDKQAAATATGFVGAFAYTGAATAGWPMGKIAQDYGWDGFFLALFTCCIVAFAMLIPLWSVASKNDQIKEETSKEGELALA